MKEQVIVILATNGKLWDKLYQQRKKWVKQERKRERAKVSNNNGQYLTPEPKYFHSKVCRQASLYKL